VLKPPEAEGSTAPVLTAETSAVDDRDKSLSAEKYRPRQEKTEFGVLFDLTILSTTMIAKPPSPNSRRMAQNCFARTLNTSDKQLLL